MAVIQKIRDKYAKLAGGVIVIALVGFILMDYGKGGGSRSTTIGKVNGEKIDARDYDVAVKQREDEMKRQNPNATVDENTQAQLRDQVWNEMVSERLLNDISQKLGITVGSAELKDMVSGPNPDPTIKQMFTNQQTGVFNPQEVAAQIQQIKRNPESKKQWDAFEAGLVKSRYTTKFNTMVTGAIYIPKFMLDDQHTSRNTLAKINYVKLPYTLVPDDQAKVSDDDIKKYMEAHKAMFQVREASRAIDFVSFTIQPSAEDSASTFAALDKLKTEFAVATNDTDFVNRNSQSQIPIAYFTKQQLQSIPNVDELMSAPVNSIVGPFYDGNNYMLAKIKDRKSFPDSVKCRHILIATRQLGEGGRFFSDTAAKARIDSVMAMVKAGAKFDSLAATYSDDAGSKNKGGEYDFPLGQKGSLAKEFGDFVFEQGHTGESKIVKTELGYHYIEILHQGAPEASTRIAFVARELATSDNTQNAISAKATQFASQATSGFDKAVKANGYSAIPAGGLNKNSYAVNGLGASRDLVKWAYDAKLGDVSSVYAVGDKYIVAKLTSIMEPGMAPINSQTRPILEGYVKKEKKAEILKQKAKGKTTLEAIAQAENLQVGTADSLSFIRAFVPNMGNEPKVVGYSFCKTFKENTLSPAISGQDGVFFINVLGRSAITDQQPRNLAVERQMLEYGVKNNASSMVLNGLREKAEVEDTRSKIY
ncbi:peptidylprolyl isomerase [Taibaiella koreensis]|uniref:peptidylprolyl isomerase n=1 Tax=Taibaiella koreensis TaxID=1268548 RepID=UPI000E599DD1|nr:peptidylprolyl isomerase [Taibaiella koreensis]